MKSDYHRGTILLTNGVQHNIQLHQKPRHHLASVTLIDSSKTVTTNSSGSSGKAVGYLGSPTAKGTNNNIMSLHDDPRITHKVNLAAAFHDHISCTKLPSQISKNGGDISSLIGASLNNGSCIDTNNSLFGAAAGSSGEDKVQIKKLKDMILMQLDLIQHQQEQLLKKERQLQGLKNDRETLCLKIEKMESRINFLTRKLLEVNSDTISAGAIDPLHLENINELNTQSSDSEMMISCMSDTNDVSNMFINVYSTPSPALTSNPMAVSPRTSNSSLLIPLSSVQSPKPSSVTEVSTGDKVNEEARDIKPKSATDSVIKVETGVSKEVKSEEVIEVKKNTSKDGKKSAVKRKRSSVSSKATPTTSTITTTTISTSTTTSTSSSNTSTTLTKSTKNASAQVNKGDLPVLTNGPTTSESSNEATSLTQPCSSKKRRRTLSKCSSIASDYQSQQHVNSVNCKSTSTNISVLETNEPYDLYNCRQEKIFLETPEAGTRDTPIRLNQIEVPSWRIVRIPGSSSTDDIEILDDDVFLKRHQKLENDERRRKRWDIQRLREQKLNERLRSGRYYYSAVNFDRPLCSPGSSKQNTYDLISFFPDPKGVQFIEVSDKIPVMAFGLPIPSLPPKPFTLPWLRPSSPT